MRFGRQRRAATDRPLLLDLDGVLRRWEAGWAPSVERLHGLPPGSLPAEAFASPVLADALVGRATDEQWRADVASRLTERYGVQGVAAVAEWSGPVGDVDQGVLRLVRAQRALRRVVLVTNATSRLPRDLTATRLDVEVDAVFSSAGLGLAKPDPELFRQVAAGLGVTAQACLFVDDSAENVAAATSLGMTGHVYRGVAGLEAFLAEQQGGPAQG